MPENDQLTPRVPDAKAVPNKRTRLSFVWVIPIVAAAAGVWIAVTNILEKGPEITIVFSSGEGLEANKTKIEYDGIEIGKLTAIRLAEDHKHVVATAAMHPKTQAFLVKDLKFWVVKPRMSGLNITGLGTLLSGHYIGVQLGESHEEARHFVALETPPLTGDVPGRIFTLKTTELGSLGAGTPIYFRQIPAGQVVSCILDPDGLSLTISIFVEAPYDQFITPDTRFWNASGIDMSLSASGLRLQTESLMSILAGGVAFETPATGKFQTPSESGTTFTLFSDREEAFRPPPHDPIEYLLVFKQSVRGLTVGAPVQLGGVTIGEVTKISPQVDAKLMEFSVPVTVSVDPARYGVKFVNVTETKTPGAPNYPIMDAMVARGLRAQLKTGNLLSGALYVSVDFHSDAPPVTLDWSQHPVELPTLPSSIQAIEDSAAKLMGSLDQTLAGVRGTLTNADQVLGNAGTFIAPDSMFNAELNNMLQQGGGAARSLRVLADYLERHPEALIRGKTGEAK